MKTYLNKEIRELKELLKNDKIDASDAINSFVSLLSEFNDEFEISDDYIILQHISKYNNAIKTLLEDQKKAKSRLENLNSIIVLQELGVKFEEEELIKLLKKQ